MPQPNSDAVGKSGAYFPSERYSSFAKFQVGMGDPKDLREKCHGLGGKPYQIIALQSCLSYDKYCRTFQDFLREAPGNRSGEIGFIGNSAEADMCDFVPRYSAFLEMLLAETGTGRCYRLDGSRREFRRLKK